jgi:hypothetical protein
MESETFVVYHLLVKQANHMYDRHMWVFEMVCEPCSQ